MRKQRNRGNAARTMDVSVDDREPLAFEDGRIERRLQRDGEIRIIRRTAKSNDAAQILRQKGAEFRERHSIDLVDDAVVVRRDDLAAVLEIGLEAVVVRRVVARGDHHAAMGLQPAHRETELRGGTRRLENERHASEPGPGRRGQLAEMPREMPHVVGDDQLGRIIPRGAGKESVHVAVEADRGAHVREIIHHVAADRRMLRRAQRTGLSGLALRGHDANRATAHPASAKFEIAVEAVVELAPGALGRQL